MCIEVYSPEVPIVIPFESEVIRFTGPRTYKAVHSFLVRNTGHLPLATLNVLYPRQLFSRQGNTWIIAGLRDVTAFLPFFLRGIAPPDPGAQQLTFIQDDPNRPQFERAPLTGWWLPDTGAFRVPLNFPDAGLFFFYKIKSTVFQIDLGKPLRPQEARWFSWEIEVEDVGVDVQSMLGRMVLHQLASPHDVWRTTAEQVESALRISEKNGPDWMPPLFADLWRSLGFAAERRVEIEYYALDVLPGDPKKIVVLGWQAERDLRMRGRSPRVDDDPLRTHQPGELIYEWKSGSLLKPDANPWKNQGFILHLSLLCK